MFFILFAILQPVFYKIIFEGSNVMVDQNGYNGIAAIFGMLLLLLMGIAPFLAWRKTSRKILKKIFNSQNLSDLNLIFFIIPLINFI